MKLKYFKDVEFECPCCGQNKMNQEILFRLDALRGVIGRPIRVNSGYRCVSRNKFIGGSDNSYHLKGMAVDIKMTNAAERYEILRNAFICGFRGIGLANTFIHLDIRDDIPVVFFYE